MIKKHFVQSEPEQLGASQKDKQTELRSQSFREQTGSPRLERSDRQNSLPPEGSPSMIASGGGAESASGHESSEPTTPGSGGSTPAGSGGSKKRLQRVEILKIVDSPPMIEPSQVVVNKARVLVADPVVTPFEMLRQKVLRATFFMPGLEIIYTYKQRWALSIKLSINR
jgi:hypothetical protein